jgi:hypothetical protein
MSKQTHISLGVGILVVISMLLDTTFGWSQVMMNEQQKSSRLSMDGVAGILSRKDAVNSIVTGCLCGTVALIATTPLVAKADITIKVATSGALKNLKRAQSQLPKLLSTVQSNDFVGVKAFLRNPPFDEVRKNGFILVRGGEDGPKAAELEIRYKTFISALEKIDGTASLGMRGRKVPPLQMSAEYDTIQATLDSFLKVSYYGITVFYTFFNPVPP